ncbi:PPOX class F420-dependent oxidoreductase [Micromonospora aurantiaca]|uniref:PPOX class F420-dependent oxidoreductase n=2 Tax=Micromonospora TaxID=1873 RepID=A0A1C6T904_9ACTN|nr:MULTISPECIES: PPOX class F420-dependent oxidoreductase [Micromonospora]ADL44049.1 putative F420-dependent enzyme [Micromonospora aurantiaca ATCC 27029]ADU06007.1 putative F420-dependent enzyme [Micromonospora sp. L5]AXH90287.1 PPOX class F420-dependent oxidoreductase [Micromonospora aurantiaca]KAB1109242.1 PPOX class F420-dependent oxidoreductase [Micromonospora aurantiaca]MBC9002011.1 PPOX class F420-dependent oxidoreductase [Micromonospora aurantiaca]
MAILSEEDLALLGEPQLAHVATIEADGTPHVTPVWVDTDGEHIVFNTAKGRQKYLNMSRNPVVAVSVADKADDFRTLWIKGTVEFVTEGADEHIDRMAKKYLGQDTYPWRRPGEERVIVRVTPTEKLGRG